MDDRYYNISYAESPFGTLNEYMTKTFGWMFAGLLATFGVALATAVSGAWLLLAATGLMWVLIIAELVMVVVLSARVTKLRPGTATGLFFGYAVLNGVNLSTIFIAYDISTLVLAFLVGAVYFGIMAVYGWRTDSDLTGWGPKLLGGLFALVLISLVGSLFGMLLGVSFGMLDLVYCALALLLIWPGRPSKAQLAPFARSTSILTSSTSSFISCASSAATATDAPHPCCVAPAPAGAVLLAPLGCAARATGHRGLDNARPGAYNKRCPNALTEKVRAGRPGAERAVTG